MTEIIFVVKRPVEDAHEMQRRWRHCVSNLEELANKNTDVQLLGENVLLISLKNNLDGLSKAVPAALGFEYKYLILNEETKWIVVPGQN